MFSYEILGRKMARGLPELVPLARTRRLTAVLPASRFSHTHYFTHLHLLKA